MKVLLICVIALAIVTAEDIKRQDCVDHCTPGTNAGCHTYQICTVNHAAGCGHSCHYIL
ncbi:hypothetical protein Bpfe_021374, partial [Biomphalaria pfeifferi]